MSPIDSLIEHLKGINPYGKTETIKLWEALITLSNAILRLEKITPVLEIPSGTINSSNKEFLLSETPIYNNFSMVFKNGLLLSKTEYEIINRLLVMVTAPVAGNTLQLLYFRR